VPVKELPSFLMGFFISLDLNRNNMQIRTLLVCLLLLFCISSIAWVFWKQELRYAQPTPVPPDYTPISFHEKLSLPDGSVTGKPLFLHFFNPDCPCSKFNIKHVRQLIASYGDRITFRAIIPPYASETTAREMLGDEAQIVLDKNNLWAEACGVYTTPQAAIIDSRGALYFRGNYNRSRYCTDPETNYAEKALIHFLKGEYLPLQDTYTITPYGCSFFEEDSSSVPDLLTKYF
jgi:hypothetical protein